MSRAALAVVVLLAAGCGATRDAAEPGGPFSVDGALERAGDDPVAVRGFLVVDGAAARLCSALAESYPPQCGGASLLVEGLPDSERRGLEEAEGVAWSEREVTLRGAIDRVPPHGVAADGVLRVR